MEHGAILMTSPPEYSPRHIPVLSSEKLARDQLRTTLWYRLYQLTGTWYGASGGVYAETWMHLNINQLFLTLAPWSVITFRSEDCFFLAMEIIMGPLLKPFVVNQLRTSSLNIMLSSRLLHQLLGPMELSSIHTNSSGDISTCIDMRLAPELAVALHGDDMRSIVVASANDSSRNCQDQKDAALELLAWNDACFDVDDAEPSQDINHITLQVQDCGVYTSPGGFNSAHDTSGEIVELAMDITQQLAILSDSPGPIPTDMPLLFIQLSEQALSDLHSWLQTRYNWREDISDLLAPNLSAEVLAMKVAGPSAHSHHSGEIPFRVGDGLTSPASFAREMNAHAVAEALPDGVPEPSYSGATTHGANIRRRSRHLAPKMNLSIVIYPNDELPSIEIVTSPEIRLPLPRRRIRLQPKTDLSIAVHADSALTSIKVTTSPEVAQAPAVSHRTGVSPSTPSKYLNGEVELDIGMASYATWNGGKKASLFAGLLTISTLLSPLPRSPLGPFSTALQDVRSPPAPRASILSPFLDVVHIQGLEPIQSPWIADYKEPDLDMSTRFPQSPFVF